MTAVDQDAPPIITEPGIYEIPEDLYHADPVPAGSLSVSGAKKLLPPSCPAKFDYERRHPAPPTSAMERGTAAHMLVLGTGPRLVHIDADDWRKKDTQEQGKAARAEGAVPLLTKDYLKVQAMAKALREHPTAGALFDPDRGGHAEQSLFWLDERWGVWRRQRVDWLPDLNGGRPIIGDYKTTTNAAPSALGKTGANFHYEMQASWYPDGVEALTGVRCPFVLVFQETTAPYLVSVAQWDAESERSGALLNQRALEIYRDCSDSGVWPGYGDEVETISLPPWARVREDW